MTLANTSTRVVIAMTEELFGELVGSLGDDLETAATLTAGIAVSEAELTVLPREVRWVPEQHYLSRDARGLTIASPGFVPGFSRAAREEMVPVFFHSHPNGGPGPSRRDEKVESDMRRLALIRTGKPYFLALILGGTPTAATFSARLFVGPTQPPIEAEKLRVVGTRIRILPSGDFDPAFDPTVFDRQVRAFGRAGQATLSSLTVGVVGAGGTGSPTFELLTRLGVGKVIVIDDDIVTSPSITRGHESGIADVGDPKVAVLERAVARIGIGTEVVAVVGRVTSCEAAKALRHADVVFGCTDDHWGRSILSRLSTYYLVPVIDMGVLIDATEVGLVREVIGRVSYVAPGSACLRCRGQVDPDMIRVEQLRAEQRERLAAEGYAPVLAEPAPSVVSYTTTVAGMAVSEMLDRLFSLSAGTLSNELRLRTLARKISRSTHHPDSGCYCEDHHYWGMGDRPDFLGLLWTG